ncbi:MAG: type II toxin-antitoxin system RelE/ParE family toxin [Betaproteobacteria bacterium]|nr:MAG: type II toxin-antitoxin system RelE/ParE family toxin [Betaproteobacteria bacterium]
MAEYRLLIKASAAKEIEALGTKADRQRVIQRIRQLATDPRTLGSEKLAGYADRYRVRQGQYRIIYLIDDGRHEVTIFKVGHRRDVYR